MKRLLAVTLGILTAIGGFVDIGDIVANADRRRAVRHVPGSGPCCSGVGGIIVYAEMAGRVAAVSGRPTFDLVRERLGARMGLANLGASFFINLLTLIAEVAGMARRDPARDRRELPAVDPADRAPRVDRDLAGEVLDDGDRLRPHRPRAAS